MKHLKNVLVLAWAQMQLERRCGRWKWWWSLIQRTEQQI